MSAPLRLLMIEDSEDDALLIRRELQRGGYELTCTRVQAAEELRVALADGVWDLVLCDYVMPRFSGPAALAIVKELGLDLPFIIISGKIGEETAVEMMRAGAHDFVMKDNLKRLVPAVSRELREAEIRRERTLAQALLKESEANFRTLARLSPVGLYRTDPDGNCMYVNERWSQITGLNVLEALGSGWVSALHADDRSLVSQAWRATVSAKSAFQLEFRFCAQGKVTWVLGLGAPEYDEAGNFLGYVGTITDITSIRAIQDELTAKTRELSERIKEQSALYTITSACADVRLTEEDLYQLAVELLPTAYQYPDIAAARIVCGDASYTAGAFAEQPWMQQADVVVEARPVARIAVCYAEERRQRDEGPFLNEERKLIDAVAAQLGTGVARRRADAALAASEKRFRSLIENASDLVVVLDAEGGLRYVSPSITRLGGYEVDEVRGAHFMDFVHPDDAAQAASDLAVIRGKGAEAHLAALRYRRKDGSWIYLESIARNLLDEPAIGGIVINARDITERKLADQRLLDSEEKYRSLTESLDHVVYSADPATLQTTFVNAAVERLFGYSVQEWLDDPALWERQIHPEDHERTTRAFSAALRDGVAAEVEHRIITKQGEIRWVLDRCSFVRDAGGNIRAVAGIVSDITERKAHEARIARLTRIRTMLSSINAAIVRLHKRDELFEEACRIAVEHGGLSMAWIGMIDPETLMVGPAAKHGRWQGYLDRVRVSAREDTPEGETAAGHALRSGSASIHNRLATDAGFRNRDLALAQGFRAVALFPLLVDSHPVGLLALYASEEDFFDDEELGLLNELTADIAFALDHIAKEEKVRYLALYDTLTDLPNHAYFSERLTQQIRNAELREQKIALVVTDVERFRNINDTFGRHAGDALLKAIAGRLAAALGKGANLGRIEADRFAFVVDEPVLQPGELAHSVERTLEQCFSQEYDVAGQALRISARAGLALAPADGRDSEALLRSAGAALQKAREAAEKYTFYAPDMNMRVAERLTLENKLRRALEREEFVLYYQPKVNARSGELVGLEALMRWNDPDSGRVQPGEFIGVLEDTALILPVGDWVIRRALADYAAWAGKGLQAVRIAVNVSAIQFRRKEFLSAVAQAIGGAAHGLDIELTETVIMTHAGENVEKLRALRDMGVGIAIDDFGTGYSSLRYIAKLPLDTLKIDRSFIVAMTDSSDDMAIVSSVISLGHDLGLKIVAEGVDSEEQAKLLRLLKCDQMQGYLFGEPMSAVEMERELAKRQASPARACSATR